MRGPFRLPIVLASCCLVCLLATSPDECAIDRNSLLQTHIRANSGENTLEKMESGWKLDPNCDASQSYCSCSAGGASAGYVIQNSAKVQKRQCAGWCSTNSAAWIYKCNWPACAACMGKKDGGTGCCVTTTTTTTMGAREAKARNARKKQKNGLLCSDMLCLNAFKLGVSWFYSYNLLVKDANSIQILNDNDIEFVPMSDRPVEWATAAGKACTWVKPKFGWSPPTKCDVNTIIDTVALTDNQLKGKAKAKYLAMFNEAYLDCPSSQCQASHIEPKDLVDVWRKYFIPAAKKLGLGLVSPTFKGDEEKYQKWAANVLAECYKLRNEVSFPCDIGSLKALSVHAYQCSEQFYEDYYSRNGKYSWTDDLMHKIKGILGSEYESSFFAKFFKETPVWVTEFSCAADSTYKRYPNGFKDQYPYGQAPYDEQCQRASGQKAASHGKGVVQTFSDMSEIERFSWFGLVVASNFGDTYVGAGNNVITKDGVVTPTGKLLVADYSQLPSLNCSIPPGMDGKGDGNGGTDNPDNGK